MADSNYQANDGEVWYYSQDLGLYFSNPNLVGIGFQLHELEDLDAGRE